MPLSSHGWPAPEGCIRLYVKALISILRLSTTTLLSYFFVRSMVLSIVSIVFPFLFCDKGTVLLSHVFVLVMVSLYHLVTSVGSEKRYIFDMTLVTFKKPPSILTSMEVFIFGIQL